MAVEQHRQQSPLPSERKACCCVVALAGWHSGQGSRVCNSTTISSVQEPCSTLAGVGHFGHRFLAFWLSHFAALTCGVPQGEALSVSEEKLFRPLPLWRYLLWITILVMVPRIGVILTKNDVPSEVLNRAYSAALMSGVHDGSATRSPARSAQPAIIRHDKATLEDVTANNELSNRPCSLYFKYAKSTFDLRSLLQDVKKIGISLASVRCVQKVSSDAYNITFATPEERRLFYEKSEHVSRSVDAVYSVYVYDAPCELPDAALAHCLSQYGEVKKIIRRTYPGYGRLETGVRIAKMSIHDPLYLHFLDLGDV